MDCNNCGITNSKGDKLCVKCGALLNGTEEIDTLNNNYSSSYENMYKENENNDITISRLSIFLFFPLIWFIWNIVPHIGDDGSGGGIGFFIIIFGLPVTIFTIVSFILGLCAIKKYYRINGNKHIVRKIINVLNIVTLFFSGLYLLLLCIFIIYIFLVIFL